MIMNTFLIACETVINEMLPFMPTDMLYQSLEPGLHLEPDKLRGVLQDAVDQNTGNTDTIVLGYGLCSMAVIGLRAAESTLVVPRADDCIAMLLGSQENYKQVLKEEPGTYFLSKGWIESGINIVEEFKQMEAKYGKKNAEMVKEMMFKNYTRLALISTGQGHQKPFQNFARRAAEDLSLRYEQIQGTDSLLRKMANGPWDGDFVVVPPGQKIKMEYFGFG